MTTEARVHFYGPLTALD